jgi:hypothetical protein
MKEREKAQKENFLELETFIKTKIKYVIYI